MGASSFNTWSGTVSDGDDITLKIANDLGIENLVIYNMSAEADDALKLEFSPPANSPNAITLFFAGSVYQAHTPNASEGIGMQGATKVIVHGNGYLTVNFAYAGRKSI